jgi:lipoprotein-releasing system ATP-binding protein
MRFETKSPQEEDLLLEIRSLEKSYKTGSETVEVLKEVNLDIHFGDVVVITGESGSGKTTLLNLAGGLDRPTRGRILFRNKEIDDVSEDDLAEYRNRSIGFIFQFHYLLKDFTALENIVMPAYLAGASPRPSRERASELLASVGLEEYQHRYPSELSGGERQRVAVARALMNEPPMVLADEPTGNLDERNSSIVEELLFELVKMSRTTLLLVTHDRSLAARGNLSYELAHGILRRI